VALSSRTRRAWNEDEEPILLERFLRRNPSAEPPVIASTPTTEPTTVRAANMRRGAPSDIKSATPVKTVFFMAPSPS
jgi:hypothetical protein